VTPFSFEGEKDIDSQNPKRLRFYINGVPAAVRLFIWGGHFSSLFYTEIGEHNHGFDAPTDPATRIDPHTHSLAQHTHEVLSPPHRHKLLTSRIPLDARPHGLMGALPKIASVNTGEGPAYSDHGWLWDGLNYIEQVQWPFVEDTPIPRLDGNGDPVQSQTTPAEGTTGMDVTGDGTELHRHQIPPTAPFGAPDASAHGPHTPAYGWLNDMHISLRVTGTTTDITDVILRRLSWTSLGAGTEHDLLNQDEGTGEIDLLAIAEEKKIDLSLPGPYELTFSVANGGGKVAYNLFVE
jgi:hypothetical protein